MSAHECRNRLLEAKQRFGRNEITIDELYVVADAYIAAMIEYKKRTGNKKMRIPARGYLIRAS